MAAEVNFAFHDFALHASAPGDRFTVRKQLFERHLDAIKDAAVPVRVTVDDGFRSAQEIAAPALEARGLTGLFFVITADIGRPRCLSAAAVRELHAAGHEIGSHTHSHPRNPYLKDLPDPDVADEWRRSKDILEDVIGAPVRSASTPYGFYSARVGRHAAAEGYEHLYISAPWTVPRRREGLELHGRFGVIADTPPEKIAALCRLDPWALRREQVAWCARLTGKRVLGSSYFKIRHALLARRHV